MRSNFRYYNCPIKVEIAKVIHALISNQINVNKVTKNA